MPPWAAYELSPGPAEPAGVSASRPARHKPSAAVAGPHLPLTPDPTPPSSLPASTPGSPEDKTATKRLPRRHPVHPRLDDGEATHPLPAGRRRRKRTEANCGTGASGSAQEEAGSVSSRAPPSPETKSSIAFPCAPDDYPHSAVNHDAPGRVGGRRTATQSTTTTSTRKTERRQVRYSLPSLDHLAASPPALIHARARSPSTGSSTARSPAGSHRRSFTSHSSRPSRRSTGKLDPKTSSPARKSQRWPAGSSHTTPATSSPFFRRSSSASNFAVQCRQSASRSGEDFALLPTGSLPFVRPLVHAFAFFVVSAVAAVTISAVLAASFSLTFYDDCSRRVGSVQRTLGGSIEGVRAGMGRMIGNARGALDLAVRAAGGTKLAHFPSGVDAQDDEHRRTTIPTSREDPEPELEFNAEGVGAGKPKRTRSTSAQADPSVSAPSPTKRRRSFFRAPPPSFTPVYASGQSTPREFADFDAATSGATTPGWRTDEDEGALPFNVPHSTPRSSRAASPQRAQRQRASGNALPPRPPLAVLIPSILFALVLTLVKVLFQAWKGRGAPPKARASP